jgi:hypothetical protein
MTMAVVPGNETECKQKIEVNTLCDEMYPSSHRAYNVITFLSFAKQK